MPKEKNHWDQLVNAARDARASDPTPEDDRPSHDFLSRMAKMRHRLWKIARTILWRRWSLFAALGAIILYLVVYFVLKSSPPGIEHPLPLPLPPAP